MTAIPTPIQIAIHGAAGRMGQRLVALAAADKDLTVAAAVEWPLHPRLGEDAGVLAGTGPLGIALSGELDAPVDVVIDFSTPAGTETIVNVCVERGIPLVVATTGLSEAQRQELQKAAKTIPLLYAPSMSVAVNLAMKLTEIAAAALKSYPSGADVEIIERHHRFKEDAPSGTALKFGQIIAGIMGQTEHRHGREGRTGARPHGEIGYHAVRVGDNPGEHTIIFGLLGETLEVTVCASNRDCYALGALAAAKFLMGKKPGLYGMNDVLGL
ncbi:MAG: 4-hydroxy-tetrahydrodipicolinate reductase [Pirellulales bacterium]